MIVIYLFLTIIALFSYIRKRYLLFLICYLGLMTKMFMFDTSEEIILRGEDLCIFLNLLLLPIVFHKNSNIFAIKQDRITKWVCIYIALYVIELCITVSLGIETFINSAKVIRVSFLLLAYFLFRVIPVAIYKKFIRFAFALTILQTLCYFLQFLGLNILAGNSIESSEGYLGMKVALNIPTFTFFFLFLVLKANLTTDKKVLLFISLLSMIFLTFARGWIISILVGIFYYILIYTEKSKKIPLLLSFCIFFILSTVVIGAKTKAEGGESTSSNIIHVISHLNKIDEIDKNNGNMAFRFAMLAERIIYLTENPQYLLLGVGTMHEDSPRTRTQFNFIIGTMNLEREGGKCQIESGDITWVPIILRYGIVGVFIHVMILVVVFLEAKRRKDNLVILAPLSISMFLLGFDGAFFENPVIIYKMTFFLSLLSRVKLEHCYLRSI